MTIKCMLKNDNILYHSSDVYNYYLAKAVKRLANFNPSVSEISCCVTLRCVTFCCVLSSGVALCDLRMNLNFRAISRLYFFNRLNA